MKISQSTERICIVVLAVATVLLYAWIMIDVVGVHYIWRPR